MLSLTECVLNHQNNALWDTHLHALSAVIKEGPFEFPTAVLVEIT